MKTLNLTPHIGCAPEDFAKTVLMPGDPLRANMIAETYFTDAELVLYARTIERRHTTCGSKSNWRRIAPRPAW